MINCRCENTEFVATVEVAQNIGRMTGSNFINAYSAEMHKHITLHDIEYDVVAGTLVQRGKVKGMRPGGGHGGHAGSASSSR